MSMHAIFFLENLLIPVIVKWVNIRLTVLQCIGRVGPSYPFLLLWLSTKSSSSSLSSMIRFFVFTSPFFDACCGFLELSGLLGGGDLIGVPVRSCFCFFCFFSKAFLAFSGDSMPCSINLHIDNLHVLVQHNLLGHVHLREIRNQNKRQLCSNEFFFLFFLFFGKIHQNKEFYYKQTKHSQALHGCEGHIIKFSRMKGVKLFRDRMRISHYDLKFSLRNLI